MRIHVSHDVRCVVWVVARVVGGASYGGWMRIHVAHDVRCVVWVVARVVGGASYGGWMRIHGSYDVATWARRAARPASRPPRRSCDGSSTGR